MSVRKLSRASRLNKQKALELYRNNQLEKALALFDRVCSKDDGDADAECCMHSGVINARLGNIKRAEHRFRHLVLISPDFAQGHYYLGAALEEQGLQQQALDCYKRAIALDPAFARAHYNMGNIYRAQGLYELAEGAFWRALGAKPDYLEALNNLGSLLKEMEKIEAAIQCFQRVLQLGPDSAGIHVNLGNAGHRLNEYQDAIAEYRKAISLDPSCSIAYMGIAGALFKVDRIEDAMAVLDEAEANIADATEVALSRASIYEKSGQYEKACQTMLPYHEAGQDSLDIAIALVTLCGHAGRCPEACANLEKIFATRQISASDRLRGHFAMGKAYNHMKDYDKAFLHYRKGNDLSPSRYDRDYYTKKTNVLIKVFDADLIKSAPRSGLDSDLPVFIVGMPRSGTTLVEQIIASHPQAFGAGELPRIPMIPYTLPERIGTSSAYPDCMKEFTQVAARQVAGDYLDYLRSMSDDSVRITDKLPDNYLHLGLINLLFPNARIVHCVREPMDNCLSCYFQSFDGYHPYAYQLEDLGFHYRLYQRLMAHWEQVLDIPILTVRYEDMIEEQEMKSRELIEFCGLEWDDRCLRFHENKRPVKTASYDQVRRPIYKSSLQRWRHYEKYLAPLRKALGGS